MSDIKRVDFKLVMKWCCSNCNHTNYEDHTYTKVKLGEINVMCEKCNSEYRLITRGLTV